MTKIPKFSNSKIRDLHEEQPEHYMEGSRLAEFFLPNQYKMMIHQIFEVSDNGCNDKCSPADKENEENPEGTFEVMVYQPNGRAVTFPSEKGISTYSLAHQTPDDIDSLLDKLANLPKEHAHSDLAKLFVDNGKFTNEIKETSTGPKLAMQ